jgi:hypothetical protein
MLPVAAYVTAGRSVRAMATQVPQRLLFDEMLARFRLSY